MKRRVMAIASKVYDDSDRLNFALVAAGIGFFSMLSIFPALALVVMVWGWGADPAQLASTVAAMDEFLPQDVQVILNDQLQSLIAASQSQALGWATLLTLGLSLWSAQAGVGAVVRGLNAVFRVPHKATWLGRMAQSFGLTLVIAALAIVVFLSVLIAPLVIALVPLGPVTEVLLQTARWLIGVGAVGLGFGILYRYGPNIPPPRLGWITPGTIFATGLWLVASIGLSVYVSRFANYNEVYGSLGAAVAILMWFYLSAYAVLIGGAINAELRRADVSRGVPPDATDAAGTPEAVRT